MDLGFKSAEDYMNLCMCNTPPVELLTVMGKEAAGDSMCIRGRARLCRRTAVGSAVHGVWPLQIGKCGGVGLSEGGWQKESQLNECGKGQKTTVIPTEYSPHVASNSWKSSVS